MANATNVSKEPGKRRRWLRILAWLVGALILLGAVAYFVVTSPAFIKGVVLPRVGNALNANITVKELSFSPFKQIVLRDLTVQAKGEPPVLVVPEASVRYHLWDILGGNIRVDEIAFTSPTVELVEGPDGKSNLDPLLKALKGKPSKAAPPKLKPSKAPQVDLGKLTLRNARVVEIKNYGDGRSNVLALTNLDLTLSNVKNGQSATFQLSADLRVDENPPGGTNGFLAAAIRGNFHFSLTPDLHPASASGKAQLAVSDAGGAFGGFSRLGAGLDCEVTPTQIKRLDLHFQNAGASLGELSVSGPLNLAAKEGKLRVALQGVDRRLLNLAGAAHDVDFDSTTVSSTNEIVLTNSGKTVAATGRFTADKFQVTRAGQTTPALDLSADYAVTVNNNVQTALLRRLTLTGTQDGRSLLAAQLSQPMSLAWGNRAGSVGNSALDLSVTNLNLADWRPFLGGTASAGNADLQMKLSSRHGGKQLGFDLQSQVNHLVARLGSNQTFQATVALSAQGQVAAFQQFSLSAYRLQITRQKQPLLTASGSGSCNLADANVDAQVALEAALPGLCDAFPLSSASISSGTLTLNGRVTQEQATQTVSGHLSLANLTGQIGKNSFSDFGSTMEVVVSRTPKQIQIKKLDGALTQKGNAGGNFALTGMFASASKRTQLHANLSGFNQDGLRPFLEPLLADKQLVSIAVNGSASVQYAPGQSSGVKADLQVTNLVVHDPTGQFPATPLAATLKLDTALRNQSADIRQFQLGLTPTDRAPNRLELQGQVNFSRPKTIQGNLKLSSAGLDLTRYYDLFTAANSAGKAAPASASASPVSAPASQEPPPKNLPFKNFAVAADIRKLYLREVAVTNFQTTVNLDGSHVQVKPFQLVLNGAPVDAALNLDLGVPGYKYHLVLDGDQIPFTPLVNSFMTDRRGELAGMLTAHAKLSGAGTTPANWERNLAGQFNIGVTNLELSVINIHSSILKSLINVVATIPQLASNPESGILSIFGQLTGQNSGLIGQLKQAPIEVITAEGQAGGGQVNLQQAVVRSKAFEADASGTITLAPVLTNSVINIPITILLSRPIAHQLNLAAANNATGSAYVPLPQFLTMTGTLGDPKTPIKKAALVGLTVKSLGTGLLNQATNPATPVGGLLNQLLRKVK